jgi:hypothetical protein
METNLADLGVGKLEQTDKNNVIELFILYASCLGTLLIT